MSAIGRLSILLALLLCFFCGIVAAEDILVVVDENGTTTIDESALGGALEQTPISILSDQEREGLVYMVEEEKLAGDVYLQLYQKWNLPIFRNIGNAERTHEGAVRTLLQRYDLRDPTLESGRFSNETLQKLYDELVSRGSGSLVDALRVGAAIEELDIIDLQERIAQTDKWDIRIVYQNLIRGSENHLRAFVRQLNNQGVQYEPQYLDPQEFQEITK